MRKLMLYTAVVLATLATLVILWQFNLVLLLFVLSLFTAATIRPAVNWMTARGMARPMAQILLYVIGFGGLGLLLLLVGDRLLQEINGAINHLTIDYEVVHETWQQGAAWQQSAVGILPPPFTLATAQDAALGDMLPVVMTMTQGLASAVGGLFLLLALSIYWSVDQHRFERLWLSVLPAKWRAYARDSWRETEQAVGNYLRTQIVQSLLAALLLGVGSAVIGIDYPILLAIFGAMAAFIPFFGGVLAAIVAFLLGSLGEQSLGRLAAGYTLLVFVGLELLVEPRLDAASEAEWYGAADPNRIDTIEYCYLEGEEGAYLETRAGFNSDGVEMKVRLDFGAGLIDYRGLYKSSGS